MCLSFILLTVFFAKRKALNYKKRVFFTRKIHKHRSFLCVVHAYYSSPASNPKSEANCSAISSGTSKLSSFHNESI